MPLGTLAIRLIQRLNGIDEAGWLDTTSPAIITSDIGCDILIYLSFIIFKSLL